MRVADIMSAELVTVERSEALSAAVEGMLEASAGSALVLDDGAPVGIVTSSDVLRAALEAGSALDGVEVDGAMSSPLVTIEPSATVTHALEVMAEHGIKKLPAVEQLNVRGIVTTTDIALKLPEHLAEVRRLQSRDPGKHR